MTGCASAEELANLALGNLPPRKTARISSHLSGCPLCQAVSGQLEKVSALLQSVHYPAMPPYLSDRLEAVLASE
jgi:anti-sigma factor RsiW